MSQVSLRAVSTAAGSAVAVAANERFELSPAPGGLALVQELLNTAQVGSGHRYPDLLTDLGRAQHWIEAALDQWSTAPGDDTAIDDKAIDRAPPEIRLTQRDLPRLRGLRAQLASQLRPGSAPLTAATNPDGPAEHRHGSVELTLDPTTGVVAARPRGRNVSWFVSAVLAESYQAQQHDTWRRLKLCRNTQCPVAFFDRTRNNNGVWHDVHVCGNAVNLRASRARRRARTDS